MSGDSTHRFDDLDDEGRGVSSEDGRSLRVPGVLPGEHARVHLEHRGRQSGVDHGRLLELVGGPSPKRGFPACAQHPRCGGCRLQHLKYGAQLEFKQARLRKALADHASLKDAEIRRTEAAPAQIGWRNKAQYVVAWRRQALRLCSFAPGTHALIEMEGCCIPERPIPDVAARVLALAQQRGLRAYDEVSGTGTLRYLLLRRGRDGGLMVVLVVWPERQSKALEALAEAIVRACPEVISVYAALNDRRGGAIFGERELLLEGEPRLPEVIGDEEREIALELSPRAFFQVNRAQASALYLEVARRVDAEAVPRVVELYSGIGGLSLVLAAQGARVVGVERSEVATEDARRNAALNGLAWRAQFECNDAGAGLQDAVEKLEGVDAVVVNPPRKGLDGAARAALTTQRPPRIVYVSCDPRTLARDLDVLIGAGYRLDDALAPFDMMPGTEQVEVVASLKLGAESP